MSSGRCIDDVTAATGAVVPVPAKLASHGTDCRSHLSSIEPARAVESALPSF
jgi:hypothetical protein